MTPIQEEALAMVKFHGSVKDAADHLKARLKRSPLTGIDTGLIEALFYFRINCAKQLRNYPAGIRVRDGDGKQYLYTQFACLFNLETGMESYPIYPLEIYKL